MNAQNGFVTVRSHGGLLPHDLLRRVVNADPNLPGIDATSYHLVGERVRDATSRSWNRLMGAWNVFTDEFARLPTTDRGTTLTRERWLQVLFAELGYGRLQTAPAIKLGEREYPVSHAGHSVPIHLLSAKVEVDRRAEGVSGAARMSPHAMLQELVNRSDEHRWAIVSNGHTLRLLRDNAALSRQAFVEFDLQAMMDGQVYADFVLLWLLLHQSRIETDASGTCWLDRWVDVADADGTRALDRLRDGVEQALTTLGSGLLSHRANGYLRDQLSSGVLTPTEYYRQLLRIVYRLLFLFVAEDRDLLLRPAGDVKPDTRERYERFYSTQRLRALARRQPGGVHDDLWAQLTLVFDLLGSQDGSDDLALPPLGSQLWYPDLVEGVVGRDEHRTRLSNADLLEVIRQLAWTTDGPTVRQVDYRNLGSEELGSVYEGLLELHPVVEVSNRSFTLTAGAGNERKTTGSYYTPASLVSQLLDTALDPVLDRAVREPEPETALLDITVCDPACGSGHFLVAAAHRIAERLAAVRTGDIEASPEAVQEALRDVVSRCIYGVDVNPMAIELAKVSLWLEAQVPGKPLTFLDHHFKTGNSLLGATPALIDRGIPDDAFKPITGDDRKIASAYKKQNRSHRDGQLSLLAGADQTLKAHQELSEQTTQIVHAGDESMKALHAKERRFQELEESPELRLLRLQADAWCAAFTAPKEAGDDDRQPYDLFYELKHADPREFDPGSPAYDTIREQADTYGFFHWHVEFPHLFQPVEDPADGDATGWTGGFTVTLGNPPWERVKLQEQEWFASRDPDVANAPNAAARKRLIKQLAESDALMYADFQDAKRQAEGVSHLLRDSARFPLTGVGDVNTYQVFAELFRQTVDERGRAGFIVPTGIATDHTTRHFFADLVDTKSLASVFDFENAAPIFPGVHRSYKFCLMTLTGEDEPVEAAEFAFFAHDTADLNDPERRFTLTPEDIALINPNTRTAPVFRTRRDAEICAKIYRNVPVLIREGRNGEQDENPWGITFMTMFHMSNDSALFRTRGELEADGWTLDGNVFVRGDHRYLPLYEAKMIHHFDHRWATYERDGTIRNVTPEEKADPHFEPMPRYWVPEAEVDAKLDAKNWDHDWLLAYRWVTNSTNERTFVGTTAPRHGAGNSLPLILSDQAPNSVLCLQASFSSTVLDYVARLSLGGSNMAFNVVGQLPVLAPLTFQGQVAWSPDESLATWIIRRALKLAYTAESMSGLAADVDDYGDPFESDEEEREQIRVELDAAFFHLYGLDHNEVEYIMDTFPIVKRKDEAEHGEYRTKRLIVEEFDQLSAKVG